MKKVTTFLTILLIICTLCLVIFSGCSLFITNERTYVSFLDVEESEDGLHFYINFYYKHGRMLFYDYETNDLQVDESDIEIVGPEVVLDGETTAHSWLESAEGYESLMEQVLNFAINPENPIIHALAIKVGDTVYGFCNVYSSTGNTDGIDEGGIESAVLFTYDYDTDKLTVIETLEKCIVVAFDGTGVIWYDNQTYYGKKLGGTATKICEDEAYDKGPTNWSQARFYFGGGYCIIYFHREYGVFSVKKNYEKYILVTMSGEKLAEYKQML